MTLSTPAEVMDRAVEMWRESARETGRGSYEGIYELFPGMRPESVRRKVQTHHHRLMAAADRDYRPPPPELVEVEGADSIPTPEEEEVIWQEKVRQFRAAQLQAARRRVLHFDYGEVALAFFADLHLGGEGTDYEAIDEAVDRVLATPGMYIVTVGDFVDNFIVGPLLKVRLHTRTPVSEEWVMAKRVLRRMAPRLLASVAGNHDNWTFALSGIDYFEDIVRQVKANGFFYGKDELRFTVRVGEHEYPFKVRHRWKGLSMYNVTHATERDAAFNRGYYWRVGVSAHTHTGAYCREFNGGGETALALHCGTFKVMDDYAVVQGYAEPNDQRVPVAFMDDEGLLSGTGSLQWASKHMSGRWSD